jgi:hypothetical protein
MHTGITASQGPILVGHRIVSMHHRLFHLFINVKGLKKVKSGDKLSVITVFFFSKERNNNLR